MPSDKPSDAAEMHCMDGHMWTVGVIRDELPPLRVYMDTVWKNDQHKPPLSFGMLLLNVLNNFKISLLLRFFMSINIARVVMTSSKCQNIKITIKNKQTIICSLLAMFNQQ